jgi:hypothetical protein
VHSIESTFCDLKMCFSINTKLWKRRFDKAERTFRGISGTEEKRKYFFFLSFQTQFLFEGIKGRLELKIIQCSLFRNLM